MWLGLVWFGSGASTPPLKENPGPRGRISRLPAKKKGPTASQSYNKATWRGPPFWRGAARRRHFPFLNSALPLQDTRLFLRGWSFPPPFFAICRTFHSPSHSHHHLHHHHHPINGMGWDGMGWALAPRCYNVNGNKKSWKLIFFIQNSYESSRLR